MMSIVGERARFLFREDRGVVDAATWRRHVAWLVLLVAAMVAAWLLLRPYTHHDLAQSTFLAPMTILAFLYLVVFSFAVILVAISYTMLTAKRLRDRGEPTALAGLVPLLAFCAAALHLLQDKTPDVISRWYVVGLDVLLVAVIVVTIADLGFRRSVR